MDENLAITRRGFIVAVSVIGASLGFGFSLADPALSETSDPLREVFNWIVVAPDNSVTIRVAQMELGQGAMTAMAQLLAEELAVDWSKIQVEFISIKRHIEKNYVYGETSTGASAGVKISQLMLRNVGAQIRTMFIEAASRHFKVDPRELAAKDGKIIRKYNGNSVTYYDLAALVQEVAIPPVEQLQLKNRRDWALIGRSLDRLDVPAKVTGEAIFGIDVVVPGMKYAAILMSPVVGETIESYDADKAISSPGFLKLIELKTPNFSTGELGVGALVVVADSWWQAQNALQLIDVKWARGRFRDRDSKVLWNWMEDGLEGPAHHTIYSAGNVDRAFNEAAHVVEAEYRLPYLEHAPLEPMNCTALVQVDSFEIWAPTQKPVDALETAAQVLGLPVGVGELHVVFSGGAFGRRLVSDFVAQAVQVADNMRGVPVKLIWSRENTFQHGFYRPTHLSRISASLDKGGAITGWRHRLVTSGTTKNIGEGWPVTSYSIPNQLIDVSFRRSAVPVGPLRGVGHGANAFVNQCFVDEIARALNRDPYEFQLSLLKYDNEAETRVETDRTNPKNSMLRAVLEEVAKKSDWQSRLPANRGRGIAAVGADDAYYALVCEVTLDGKGWLSVDRVVIAGDPGVLVNPRLAESQLEGSVAFGLTTALYGEITIENGAVAQDNFDKYKILTMEEMPPVEIHWLLHARDIWGGVGEPISYLIVPALLNAIYDAGGPRIRTLPLKNHKLLLRK